MQPDHSNFTYLDVIVVFAYLSLLLGIGAYFSKRQKNIQSFFLAERTMGFLPIGLSLMAALNSGYDYIAQPGALLKYSLVITTSVLSWVFLYPWVAYVTLPFYRRLQAVSAYEYLERRFNVAVRTLAACIFLMWRVGWMGTAMFVPALAIETITGGAIEAIPLILVIGTVVTIYTMLGGIQAVIWTNVTQFCIMLTGVAVAVGVVLYHIDGGVSTVWRIADAEGKTSFFFPLDVADGAGWWQSIVAYFAEPQAASAILIASVVGRMANYTSDQVMVQRFQTTKSLRDSRHAFIINATTDAMWMLGLAFVGLALFAYFQSHPLPPQYLEETDKVFPYFMANVFPTGLIGLVVAAILAASLSSIDSAINSCTSVVVVDFYNRLLLGRQVHVNGSPTGDRASDSLTDQQGQLLVSRLASVCLGIVGVAIACNVSQLGIALEIGAKVIQSFTGPILGIYVLGMFSRRARSQDALCGGLVGTTAALYVAFGDSGIAFWWPTVFGLAGTLLVGYTSLWLLPGRGEGEKLELTWRQVMRQPLPDDVVETGGAKEAIYQL